jgi:hypothetical protein
MVVLSLNIDDPIMRNGIPHLLHSDLFSEQGRPPGEGGCGSNRVRALGTGEPQNPVRAKELILFRKQLLAPLMFTEQPNSENFSHYHTPISTPVHYALEVYSMRDVMGSIKFATILYNCCRPRL